MGFAQGRCRYFRQANSTNLALLNHFGHCPYTLFDRHVILVPTVEVVDINEIRVQPSQRVFQGRF